MKWITIPINILSFRDLVQQALDYLRRDLVTVKSLSGQKVKKIDRTVKRPWHLLPSIQGFRIELSPYDWLLELFGLKMRFPNKMEFHVWKNDKSNAYIDYMFKRIRTEVLNKRYTKAYKSIWVLMNSSAYQTAALNHVITNWHRKDSLRDIRKVMIQVRKLVKQQATKIDFKRTYLHEVSKIRPLGVPSMSWRIYLHMFNNCLVEWRTITETGKQHGYLPGKGVITAWYALARKLNQPNIYEADYKGFFNNVNHALITENMIYELKCPPKMAMFVADLNSSVVKLQTIDQILEPDRKFSSEIYMALQMMAPVKSEGVPQGAPTSCSTATLALRHLERTLDVIIYADDIIYFPKDSSKDPIEALENYSMGLLVQPSKSRWLKKDGVWLVKSFKFLGIRYYPPSGIFSNITEWAGVVLQGINTYSWLYSPARFVAETRKGANLEFTNKESLLSYLAIAREILLNSKYLRNKVRTMTLIKWLLTREAKWMLLDNKAKLLFGEVLITDKGDKMSRDFFSSQPSIIQRWKAKSMIIIKNPLTGYFLSRMQSNTWDISIKQNFALTCTKSSWVSTQWRRYSWQWILYEKGLTIFNSSSFAVHDMQNWLSSLHKSRQRPIRRVYSKSKRAKAWLDTVTTLQTEFRNEFINKTKFRNYSPPVYSPKWLYTRRPYFVPELFIIIIMDLIIGFPLFTTLWSLLWYNSKSEYFEI